MSKLLRIYGEKIGIGTGSAAPKNKLHLYSGPSGATPRTTEVDLTLESSANNYIQFVGPNTTQQGIMFGDPQHEYAGYIFYSHSANQLKFSAGCHNFVNGNVGIGTTTPTELLHVNGNIKLTGDYRIHGSASSSCLYTLELTRSGSGSDYADLIGTNNFLGLGSNASCSAIAIKSNVVGIGTINPTTAKLDIAGYPALRMRSQSGTCPWDFYPHTNGSLYINNATGTELTIDIDGKVGIGIASPSYPLHVVSSTSDRVAFAMQNGTHEFSTYAAGGSAYSDSVAWYSGSAKDMSILSSKGLRILSSHTGGWVETARFTCDGNVGI